MEPVSLSCVEPRGELGDRLSRSAENMLSWAGPRPKGVPLLGDTGAYGWGADFQGRWLEAMTLLSRSLELPTEAIPRVAENLLKCQRRTGSFHDDHNGMSTFGNSRALVALVEHYRSSGESRFLKSANRLANWYIRRCGPASGSHSFTTSALEGFVELWAETGEDRHLDYAQDLVERTLSIWTDPLPEEGHLHTMLASLRAVTDLAIRMGDRKQIRRTEALYEQLRRDSVWLSGGLPEISPCSIEADEPCTTGDWIRFCLLLWRGTGKERYLDDAERALINHIFYNQLPNGGYSSTSNLEQAFRGLEAWWCCSLHAPRAMHEVTRYIWTHKGGALYLNFFLPSRVVIQLKQALSVDLLQETGFPMENQSTITVSPERAATFTLKIRIPNWCRDQPLRLRVNGRSIEGVRQGERVTIKRRWESGDRLQLSLPMPMHIESELLGKHERYATSVQLSGNECKAKRIGLFYGPLLSVVARMNHQNDMTWIYRGGYNELLDAGGMAGSHASSRNYFRINGATYDDSGERECIEKLNVGVTPRGVVMTWKEGLIGSDGRVAEIHYKRLIRSGMPVVIEEEEKLVVLGTKRKPVRLEEALMAGLRLSEKTEQHHDTYCCIWKYEYPQFQLGLGEGSLKTIIDGKRLKPPRQAVLDNGIFRVEVRFSGAVEQLATVKRERWSGLYASPLKAKSLSCSTRQVYKIKTTSHFPFPPYSERTFMPAEWTAGLMTQPIHEI